MKYFKKIQIPYPVSTRQPATGAKIIALSGAVMIHTKDDHNIVIAPRLARLIADKLHAIADQAEGAQEVKP